MRKKTPNEYYIPAYLQIVGKASRVSCIIISLLILFSGFRMAYASIKELIDYGTFWDYVFFWEYAGVLVLFIPISFIVAYYGGYFNKFFESHMQGYENEFLMTLMTVLIISFLLFIYSMWHHYIIISVLLGIPLLYFILIYHFIKADQTT